MRINNGEVEYLHEFLYNMKLSGKESRMRSRLQKQLLNHLETVLLPEKQEIVQEYALRDEYDEIVVNEDGGIMIQPALLDKCEEELHTLFTEGFIIEENETNEAMLVSVANSMLNYKQELSGQLAIQYDAWCEAFEDALSNYEKS